MTKRLHAVALATAAGALLAVPATGQADRPNAQGEHNHPNGNNRCERPTVKKGFVVKGTLVAYTADDAATPANEASVEITVTGANRHARVSGELGGDRNPDRRGVQVAGASYTADAAADSDDPFGVRLSGFDGGSTDVPSAGDKVRIVGKVTVFKKRCSGNRTLDERYGDVNIRRVKIVDATTDTP